MICLKGMRRRRTQSMGRRGQLPRQGNVVPLILLVLTTSILLFRQPLWHFLSPWILRHVQMPCVLQHFVSILCYSQWVLHVHVQNSEKKRMEARTMLGSCCIHDRPDIDTYLAYLDMYTDSYIHIYMCIYIYIHIYICDLTHTHTCTYIYTYISIYIFINSRQSEISRPTGKHISDTAPPQTQPHLWRKITTCLTSHHNIIAAPPQTQPHDHVHRTKMHEFPGAVLDDVSKKKAVVKAAERHLA